MGREEATVCVHDWAIKQLLDLEVVKVGRVCNAPHGAPKWLGLHALLRHSLGLQGRQHGQTPRLWEVMLPCGQVMCGCVGYVSDYTGGSSVCEAPEEGVSPLCYLSGIAAMALALCPL
jgi:hypothetical protein